MNWLISSLISASATSVIVSLFYFLLFLREKQKYLKIWFLAWFIYSFRFISQILYIYYPEIILFVILQQLFSVLSGVLLIYGTHLFSNKKMNSLWLISSFAVITYTVLSILYKSPFIVSNLPLDILLGSIYITTGFIFFKIPGMETLSRKITFLCLFLWGIHKANYAFLRPLEWFAPWGFHIATILFFSTAISIIMVHYDMAKIKLSFAIKEKDLLLLEIHHRIRNNLSLVSSFLHLSREKLAGNTAVAVNNVPEFNVLADAENKIQILSAIHKHLYLSRNNTYYASSAEYFDQFLRLIKQIYADRPGITIDSEVEHFTLSMDIITPLSLALYEIISNSFLHAFQKEETGTVNVSIIKKENYIKVSARDSGTMTEGNPDRTTYGLQIIALLIEQMNASFSLDKNRGFHYSILIPVKA